MSVRSLSWMNWLSAIVSLLLLAAVALMPLTSLPLLSRLMGGTLVAPPSVILVGLALVCYLPVILARKVLLPNELIPLAAFVFVALVSSLLSFFSTLPEYKNLSVYKETAQAVLTLGVGAACFIAFSSWARARWQFDWIFRLVNITGVLIVIWSAIQVYYTNFQFGQYPRVILAIHDALSVQSLDVYWFTKRARGFTLEPSWLAHQLNTFYLPYWVGATLAKYSAFRFRLKKISIENILLALGILVMFSSMSRIGYLTLMLVLAYLFLHLNGHIARRFADRAAHRRGLTAAEATSLERRFRVITGLALFGGFIFLGGAGVYILSLMDIRVAAILKQQYLDSSLYTIANNLALAERFAYWGLGWNVFTFKPFLGVGLGNVGFYFESQLPTFGWGSNEMLKLFYEGTSLVNSKNLWMRLLAETGVTGFSFFVTWLTVVFLSGRALLKHASPLIRTLGWMGVLALVALIGEGFSVDSFALPYYWVSFGLCVAGSYIARQSTSSPGKQPLDNAHD